MKQQLTARARRSAAKQNFQKLRFSERIAPTVDGVKPAEILMVGEDEYQEMYAKHLHNNQSVRIKTIKRSREKRQLLVYNQASLKAVLEKECVRWLLRNQGYPENATPQCCIKHLIRRLRGDSFPHEIGVFLGYPLKDVFGYMGLNSLPHTKTKGWCMYGDTRTSEKLYAQYRSSRKRAVRAIC